MTASVVMVGAGPRAVAVTARLIADHARLAPDVSLVIQLVDAVEVGAGRTWRTDQNRLLLNNTYCAETTVFADETVPTAGPTTPGPSLAEWAAAVAAGEVVLADVPPWVVQEARRTEAWTFPTRAFQGVYFRWALDRVAVAAPPMVEVRRHRAQVVALEELPDGQRVILSDGRRLEATVVIMTQGLLTAAGAPETEALAADAAARGLVYLPPGMPTERAWDAVPAGAPVLVRGLGANFFDLLALLTSGRGGRFVRGPDGELSYRASGREPMIIAGSRHGLPYRAKAAYATGLPEPVELRRLSADRERRLIRDHGGRRDVSAAAVLDDVLRDLADVHAAALRPGQGADDPRPARNAGSSGPEPVFDLDAAAYPADGRVFGSDADWQHFVDDHCAVELVRIRRPDTDPDKLVHRAAETARRRLSRLVLARVFEPGSVIRELKNFFLPRALVLASGPPPERFEQLVALRRAGLVELLGPGLSVSVQGDAFTATTRVPGQRRSARALAEARVGLGDLRSTDDPLTRSMIESGQARYHRVVETDGSVIETATLDVTDDQFLLIDAAGRPHPRRLVLGSPAGDVQWYAAIGAVPHSADKMLVGAERAAAYALALIARSARGTS